MAPGILPFPAIPSSAAGRRRDSPKARRGGCDPSSLRSGRISKVKIDLLFDPFGASWHDIQEGAIAAEGEGFDGVWLYDHLAGSVHGQQRVLECWTTLTAIAATVPRLARARANGPQRRQSPSWNTWRDGGHAPGSQRR